MMESLSKTDVALNESDYLLTTIDNPYDPFKDFSLWDLFDREKGHFTCDLIGRLSQISDDMTLREEEAEYDRVVDFIIEHDPHDKYKRFYRQNATVQMHKE